MKKLFWKKFSVSINMHKNIEVKTFMNVNFASLKNESKVKSCLPKLFLWLFFLAQFNVDRFTHIRVVCLVSANSLTHSLTH